MRVRRSRLTGVARRLRSESTEAEQKFWELVRDRRLRGYKFRRQVPIGPFVADFVCAGAMLIVEIDGGQHGEQVSRDAVRTRLLEAQGYRVLRFWNNEVLKEIEGVWVVMERVLRRTAPHPGPLPASGERE